jgi:hypothetical protein
VFLAARLPGAFDASRRRIKNAGRERTLGADEALATLRGQDYVAAIRRIRAELPEDSEYLLLGGTQEGADVFVRFDLAPRRAIFGGAIADIPRNVTLSRLHALPAWTVVPRLDGPGPRLVSTRLLAEKGAIP